MSFNRGQEVGFWRRIADFVIFGGLFKYSLPVRGIRCNAGNHGWAKCRKRAIYSSAGKNFCEKHEKWTRIEDATPTIPEMSRSDWIDGPITVTAEPNDGSRVVAVPPVRSPIDPDLVAAMVPPASFRVSILDQPPQGQVEKKKLPLVTRSKRNLEL